MSKRGIHSARSTNCISVLAMSKCIHSGTVTRKPAMVPIRAIQRAERASRPTASTARPATTGTQIERERYGMLLFLVPADPPGQQRKKADDHGESVVIDVAGLHVAQQR